MKESSTAAVLPEQGKRAILFLSLIAVPVLLIFLGHGELTPEESEWAGCYRTVADAAKFSEPWLPQYYNNMIFGHLFCKLEMLFPISEWMLRFPVILAAIAFTAGTILLALEIFDRKNAVFSGWLMLGAYGFLYWGRIGSSAMFAAAATVWCAALFFSWEKRKPTPFHNSFEFFTILSVTFVACGITAVLGIILLLLPLWINMARKHQFDIRRFKHYFAGLLCAMAVLAGILFSAGCLGAPENFRLDNFNRVWMLCQKLISSAGRELSGISLYGVPEALWSWFKQLLPWSLFIPAAVWGLWQKRNTLPENFKALICGTVLFVPVIGLISGGGGHILPQLAPSVIILSAGLSARFRDVKWERISELFVRSVFIMVAALAAALLCTWPLWGKLLRLQPPVVLMVISLLTGGAALVVLMFCTVPGNAVEKMTKRPSPLAGTVIAGVILSVLVHCVIFPQMGLLRTERKFWQGAADMLEQCDPAPETVMFYRCGLPANGIYYLAPKQQIAVVSTPEAADELLRNSGGKVAVITRHHPEYFDELNRIARKNRKNFFAARPLCREDLPVAFTRGEAKEREKILGLWLLEL